MYIDDAQKIDVNFIWCNETAIELSLITISQHEKLEGNILIATEWK